MSFHDHVPGAEGEAGRRRLNASIGGLLFGNFTLLVSYAFGWTALGELLWTYWFQSVIIGVFNYFRMRGLRRFSTEGMLMNKQPIPATPEGQRQVARFFALHYGFFHFIYATFLLSAHAPSGTGWVWLVVVCAMLAGSEWATFVRHRESDATWEPNLGTLMLQPYVRIIPMHLTVGASWAGIVFLPLKTAADIGMFLVDERMDAKRARTTGAAATVGAEARAG